MGLFKKRTDDPGEIDRLRAEMAAMAARLDAADAEKAATESRIQHLVAKVESPAPAPPPPPEPEVKAADLDIVRARIQRLADRVEQSVMQVEESVGTVAIENVNRDQTVSSLQARIDDLTAQLEQAALSGSGPGDLDTLNDRLEVMSIRLDSLARAAERPGAPPVDPAELADLRERIEAIDTRLDRPLSPPPPTPPPGAGASLAGDELDALRERIDAVSDRLDAAIMDDEEVPAAATADQVDQLRDRLEALAGRLDQVDARITAISTELANQITELSHEVEARADASPADDDGVADAVTEELRDAQIRLANEQARYQIAFRQELADLAERLRRS